MKNKKEIRLIIDELLKLGGDCVTSATVTDKIKVLKKELETAPEDFIENILESHKTLCRVKNMGLKDAYGQDPIMYYALAMSGEVGEMANKIVKNLRNGRDFSSLQTAVQSELPDAFIYGIILAFVTNIDITKDINDKIKIVIQRALEGYYGGPLQLEAPE